MQELPRAHETRYPTGPKFYPRTLWRDPVADGVDAGHDGDQLLARAGLPPGCLDDADAHLSLQQFQRLAQAALS